MKRRFMLCSLALAVITPVALMAPQASAEPISRSNWVPNVGELNLEGEQPLGDLWTFKCLESGIWGFGSTGPAE
jgi:hypothetical protein